MKLKFCDLPSEMLEAVEAVASLEKRMAVLEGKITELGDILEDLLKRLDGLASQ